MKETAKKRPTSENHQIFTRAISSIDIFSLLSSFASFTQNPQMNFIIDFEIGWDWRENRLYKKKLPKQSDHVHHNRWIRHTKMSKHFDQLSQRNVIEIKRRENKQTKKTENTVTIHRFSSRLPLQTKFTNVIIACLTVQHIHQRRFHSFSRSIGILFSFTQIFSIFVCVHIFCAKKFRQEKRRNKTPKSNISHLQKPNIIRLSFVMGERKMSILWKLSH